MSKLHPFLGERIRERRTALGLSQDQLAKACGFASGQIISVIEKEGRRIKVSELARIADALRVDFDFFFQKEVSNVRAGILWRERPEVDGKIKEANFLRLCGRYHKVEKLCGESINCKISSMIKVDFDTLGFEDVSLVAQNEILPKLDLGSRPAASLTEVLEKRCGIKIIYQDLGEHGSAASVVGEFGAAILMNRREAPWRRNYSFAHELFHIITWDTETIQRQENDPPLWKKAEKFADYFASVLLLPAAIIEAELARKGNNLTYMDVVNISRNMDVSTSALLWRMVSLRYFKAETVEKVLSDPDFKNLDKSTMAEKWWEPSPLPERFVRLAFKAFTQGNLSRMMLAEYLDTSLVDLDSVLADYGIKAEEEAVYETKISIA